VKRIGKKVLEKGGNHKRKTFHQNLPWALIQEISGYYFRPVLGLGERKNKIYIT
jgi:hypothetical protein